MDERDEPALGKPLPRADEAVIDPRKLTDYTLDPTNSRGRHKAEVFRVALRIERADWRYLRGAILETLPLNPVTSVRRAERPAGVTTYGVVLPVTGLNGQTRLVITTWKLVAGLPHLTGARVAKKRAQPPPDGTTL